MATESISPHTAGGNCGARQRLHLWQSPAGSRQQTQAELRPSRRAEPQDIAEPVQVYRAFGSGKDGPGPAASVGELPLPDKPSIVVLPFVNMSADAEQSYFVDGLTEDLITDLSKVPELFVIARNSSFAYKGRSVDVRQIAREMGVKYVLEGSARRAADRVRINAQLIDARAGGHFWADRFDRDLTDIFAAQDEVIAKIVEALIGKLTAASLKERYRPANLEAYDHAMSSRPNSCISHHRLQRLSL
jgi:TolB-like protein